MMDLGIILVLSCRARRKRERSSSVIPDRDSKAVVLLLATWLFGELSAHAAMESTRVCCGGNLAYLQPECHIMQGQDNADVADDESFERSLKETGASSGTLTLLLRRLRIGGSFRRRTRRSSLGPLALRTERSGSLMSGVVLLLLLLLAAGFAVVVQIPRDLEGHVVEERFVRVGQGAGFLVAGIIVVLVRLFRLLGSSGRAAHDGSAGAAFLVPERAIGWLWQRRRVGGSGEHLCGVDNVRGRSTKGGYM